MIPSFNIIYVLALPDWEPSAVTPFQGFAPGLIDFVPLMEFVSTLPADFVDPTLALDDRLARRRSGSGSWLWTPVNLSTLLAKRKPTSEFPFMVVLSADQRTSRAVSDWRKNLRIKPIHLSYFNGGNAIHPTNFTQEILRQHLVTIARKVASVAKGVDVSHHLIALNSWQAQQRRPSSLQFHSHNVTRPNEMVLISAGEEAAHDEKGHLQIAPHSDYVSGITESARAVMKLWERSQDHGVYRIRPPQPDVFLIAPAMYRGVSKRFERKMEDPLLKRMLRTLDRQQGYTILMPFADDEDAKTRLNEIGPVLGLRGAEMKLTTTAVGLRTAGTVAATIRLPPAVNRTAGVVGQLSRFLRTHERPPAVKSARVFKAVQDALLKYLPEEHLELIARSECGIKIIADAPLEWLPIKGLPLGIRFDVSRINSTPGNLFLEQIRSPMPMTISPDAFRNYLILSMFDDADQIAPYLRAGALLARDGDGRPIVGKFGSPKSPQQFAEAISSFNGPLLVIDSHAAHEDADVPGGLIINGKPFDVWSLVGKVSMPPIVVLSACDTHPFDRNHATVANGLLACGAVAVVATSLPIRAQQAARFVARIINRAVHYGSIVNKMGRTVPWPHIVGGVLRMELATDVIRAFCDDGYYDEEARSNLLLQTNQDLNPHNPSWYEQMLARISAYASHPPKFEQRLADAIAASDSIRYLHMGNPEAILVADEQMTAHAFTQME